MKLMGLTSGVVGVACSMALGMGAIEFQPPTVGLPGDAESSGPCPWDCDNSDGDVGIVDFLALLGQWGGPGACDFDGGGVGITDFLALLGNWGPCPSGACPAAATGDCCVANGTPGCDDPACCAAVCSADPFCCDSIWDQVCAQSALILCDCLPDPPDCGVKGTGSCCIDNGTPFCDDSDCCDFVCAIDPFCCDVAWDANCASTAGQVCFNCP